MNHNIIMPMIDLGKFTELIFINYLLMNIFHLYDFIQ